NITAAALFRVIEAMTPTLLVDEADAFLREKEELRGIINSGHTRATATVLRCVGESQEVQGFNTFSPKAIAMIGKPAVTITDRSIRINLKRAPRGAKVEQLRLDRRDEFIPLQRKAARWAKDSAERLRQADPAVPDAIASARDRDNWRPLLAIA